MLLQTRKMGLLLRYTDYARKLYMTKLLKEPLDLLQRAFDDTIESLRAGDDLPLAQPPVLVYSAESQQIANLLEFFTRNQNYTEIPYASSITI